MTEVYPLGDERAREQQESGAKAAGLHRLMGLGLPVPQGFVIPTAAFREWRENTRCLSDGLRRGLAEGLDWLREDHRQSPRRNLPLLVSVRSGAPVSMPGMMRTVLNVGLFPAALQGLKARGLFLLRTYERFVVNWAIAVLGLPPSWLHEARRSAFQGHRRSLRQCEDLRRSVEEKAGQLIPDVPHVQLEQAVDAVFRSWWTKSAVEFRSRHLVPEGTGTAVIVQKMVFGTLGARSGSGVVYSRNLDNGAPSLVGRFAWRSNGADLMNGDTGEHDAEIKVLRSRMPKVAQQLRKLVRKAEGSAGWPQELEFTVEEGDIWVLQTRDAPLSDYASMRVAVELASDKILSRAEAVQRVSPAASRRAGRLRFTRAAIEKAIGEGRLVARGLVASTGVASGKVAHWNDNRESAGQGRDILLKEILDPAEDIALMGRCSAFVTKFGGAGSHAATLARKLSKPYVAGCRSLEIDTNSGRVSFGSLPITVETRLSVDGSSGFVFLGRLQTERENAGQWARRFSELERLERSTSPWELACYPDRELPQIDHLRRARELLRCSPWRAAKARALDLLSIIPAQFRIPQHIVDARDVASIRALMRKGLGQGYWVGGKGCYSSEPRVGKGYWLMGVRDTAGVEDFLGNSKFGGIASGGGYPQWIKDDALTEFVVTYDPPWKGSDVTRERQFIFTISCLPDAEEICVELVPGTSTIRVLEQAAEEQLIHIRMKLDFHAPRFRGERRAIFGRSYWQPCIVSDVLQELSPSGNKRERCHEVPHPEELGELAAAVRAQGDRSPWTENLVAEVLARLIGGQNSRRDLMKTVISPRALLLAELVEKVVFGEWWTPPFELPHLMKALDMTVGYETLEFQGALDSQDSPQYLLVWDGKGSEDSPVGATRRTLTNEKQLKTSLREKAATDDRT